jgi:hypothetical protein
LRLESYLFTVQAMQAVKAHLAPGGAFSMYNFYREDWLIGRLANGPWLRASATSRASTSARRPGGHHRGAARPPDQRCAVGQVIPAGPAPATDDHPFVYLLDRSIPGFYLSPSAASCCSADRGPGGGRPAAPDASVR